MALLCAAIALPGCKSPDAANAPQPAPSGTENPSQTTPAGAVNPASASVAAKPSASAVRGELDKQRASLNEVPPPTKSRYVSVQNAAVWQNPFIVVGTHSLKVTVLMQDANPAPVSASGALLRPTGARRTIQEIRTQDLGEMLADLPAGAWPYGRVIAVEESAQAARQDRVQMRRNYEAAMQTLSNLGVVINEWNEPAR